jgi:glycosyltransferase involved in cell wall biosynthesis
VIAAFERAFPRGDEDVQLVVKSTNGAYYPAQLAELVEAAAGDARILIRDQVIDALHMRSLQRCCDAYVSLHRAEGFGLGLAECMAMGKPVVATAWSGNLDYMREENSCLVGVTLIPVLPHEYPNADGASWAQPDVSQAADWMRRLVFDTGFAERIGRQAALDVRDALSPECVAGQLIACVREVLAISGAELAGLPGEEQRA